MDCAIPNGTFSRFLASGPFAGKDEHTGLAAGLTRITTIATLVDLAEADAGCCTGAE